MPRSQEIYQVERDFGIVFPNAQEIKSAADAAIAPQTAINGGQPAWLTNILDPELVRVLVSPMKAADIFGETKKGGWDDLTITFPRAEWAGEVTSYGDYNENGSSGVNVNYIERQSYHYQTMLYWGEREVSLAARGNVALPSEIQLASAMQLNKFQNKSYFYGIAGLRLYGALNDPNLVASISPAATGSGSGTTWATKDGSGVYGDIQLLFRQLVSQTGGLVDMDTPMVLAMSPMSQTYLTNTNSFLVTVPDMLKKNFPNLRIEVAPEYATSTGNLLQLIVPEFEGVRTAYCAFTEKLRQHATIQDVSSWKQKRSQGTWGFILRRPMMVASMLGV